MELYALTLVGIDFLESTNTSDPAGKNIVNWDKVDEEGNIVEPEPDWTCNHCGEGQSEHDDGYTVFTSYTGERNGTGEFGEERYVCGHCRDEHYTYHENLDEAVLDGEVTYTDEEEE
jgi:ribosomal protein S27AE